VVAGGLTEEEAFKIAIATWPEGDPLSLGPLLAKHLTYSEYLYRPLVQVGCPQNYMCTYVVICGQIHGLLFGQSLLGL